GGALPIVPFEEDIEAHVLPGVQPIRLGFDVYVVNERDVRNYLGPFRCQNHRTVALRSFNQLIADNASYQIVATGLGLSKNVQVPNMEKVECPSCISNNHLDRSPKIASVQKN